MVDEQVAAGSPESPEKKMARLERIEISAAAFAQYFNAERDSTIDKGELAGAMAFVERLNWRTMAVALLRVHKRAAENEETLAATRLEIGKVASRLFEIERFVTQATREDLGTAITLAAGKLVTLASPGWAPPRKPEPAPEVKVGETVVPAPAQDKPSGIVLTPDPLSIDTREMMQRGARIAQERKPEVSGGQ